MPKELVISASSHETRVAILEDGQLCEIYVEREKELALVGSIYKGRVTRVLPGMQSAFVDIGLDSDAFLYVTDFVEDVEEYDQIIHTVEEKVQKMEQQGGEVFPAGPAETPAAPARPVEVAPAVERAAEPPPARPAEPPRDSRPYGGRDRGRRGPRFHRGGRGGRDRDPRRGSELPPSKFVSDHRYEPPVDAEPIILPGESLAKYKDRVPAAAVTPAQDEQIAAASVVTPASAFPPVAEIAPAAEHPAAIESSEPPAIAGDWELATAEAVFAPPAEPVEPAPPAAERRVETEATPHTEIPAAPPISSAGLEAGATPKSEVAEEHPSASAEIVPELSEEEATALAEQVAEAQREQAEAEKEAAEHSAADMEEEASEDLEHAETEGASETFETAEELAAEAAARAEGSEGAAHEPAERTARVQGPSRARFQRPLPSRRGGRRRGGGGRRYEQRPPRRQQSISELLKAGQEIIVQIAKEPLGKKGARITSHIALPGRFLVYMPTVNHIGVSRKINSAEVRLRLRRTVQDAKGGAPGGFIVRTAAERAGEEELRTDVAFLVRTWSEMLARSEQRKAPSLLHRDLDLIERVLRDQLSADYTSIWIDNEEEYTKVVDFVNRFQPQLVSRVKLYTKSAPIFEEFGIQQEIDKSLRPKVWLKSGGYIVINHTEALVAIDVNTGKFVGKGSTRLEDTIVKTNLEAVKEVVRQIRLRDLGGIIVIDFIDMEERKNRQKVMLALEDALRSDKAPSKVLAFNEFGLVAITRKRTKQALERVLCQSCPYCSGSGMVKSVPTLCYEIQAEARKMAQEVDTPSLTLRVHPEIAKALKTRESALIEELERWTRKNIIIQSDATLHWEQYDIY